jgi:transposase
MAPAAGTWLRLGHDLLATPGGVEQSRSVAASARGTAGSATSRRRTRLLQGCGGLLPDQSLERGAQTGPSPVDRGRARSKHHLITDATGIPLAVILTGAHRNDVTQLLLLLHAIPKVRGKRGRPRQRPDVVPADRGYGHDKYRRLVRELQIRPLIARRGTGHGSGLGKHRYVVEQTFALLHAFRRLRIRWEIRADIHQAFLSLACALICWRRLTSLR